jgi:hypothetical protein
MEAELFLKPLAVKSFGNVVIVHYAAEYVYDYGDGTKSGAGIWRRIHAHLDEGRRSLANHRRHVRGPGADQDPRA